jgi:hypothetical protein
MDKVILWKDCTTIADPREKRPCLAIAAYDFKWVFE